MQVNNTHFPFLQKMNVKRFHQVCYSDYTAQKTFCYKNVLRHELRALLSTLLASQKRTLHGVSQLTAKGMYKNSCQFKKNCRLLMATNIHTDSITSHQFKDTKPQKSLVTISITHSQTKFIHLPSNVVVTNHAVSGIC